ncbi:hypothetical protein MMC28_006946 [Mycoblastus sanguinarius]|nr:hypothetical protein [Mycoblastus sanguinarius]
MPEPAHVRGTITDSEHIGLKRAAEFTRTGSAYALEHATRPSTIGFALASSPIALLSWIGEKFLDWTDDDPSLDTILEQAPSFILFTPGNIGAHENPQWYVKKPLGFSWFPKEIAPIPQAWVATTGNLEFYREHQRVSFPLPETFIGGHKFCAWILTYACKGGHFAAIEQTDQLLKDIEGFVQQVWKAHG